MSGIMRSAESVFDEWAMDEHAAGMEKSHWRNVRKAFEEIPESDGAYLEIGIGNGYGIHHMAMHQYASGTCFGIDMSTNMIRKARERLRGVHNIHLAAGDFMAWEPPLGVFFTCIFSMEVFYYFADIEAGIRRAASLLAPGGLLMVLVNYYRENRESHSWPRDLKTPMTLWSESDYLNAFKRAGLVRLVQQRFRENEDGEGTLCTQGYQHDAIMDGSL